MRSRRASSTPTPARTSVSITGVGGVVARRPRTPSGASRAGIRGPAACRRRTCRPEWGPAASGCPDSSRSSSAPCATTNPCSAPPRGCRSPRPRPAGARTPARRAGARALGDDLADLPGTGRIEAVRRLVQHDEPARHEQRRGEPQPLLHAERVGAVPPVRRVRQADPSSAAVDRLGIPAAAAAARRRRTAAGFPAGTGTGGNPGPRPARRRRGSTRRDGARHRRPSSSTRPRSAGRARAASGWSSSCRSRSVPASRRRRPPGRPGRRRRRRPCRGRPCAVPAPATAVPAAALLPGLRRRRARGVVTASPARRRAPAAAPRRPRSGRRR